MMTAKEKAIELVSVYRYSLSIPDAPLGVYKDNIAKQCALIAVNETIEALNLLLTSGLNNDFDILKVRGYYMEIKQEIDKL